MKVAGVWEFFTYHTRCIINNRHQITNVRQAFKKVLPQKQQRTASSTTSIVSLLLTHMQLTPTQPPLINTLCESELFSSVRQTHKKTLSKCCTLIMIQLGPGESIHSTICATTGGESWDGAIASCAVH